MAGRPDRTTLVAFAVVVVLLGLNFVAVRFSNRELAPFWGSGARFVAAAGILAGYALARRVAWPSGRALAGAAVYGVLAFGASYGLIYLGMVEVGAGTAAVLFATTPLATILLGSATRLEPWTPRALGGAALALAGAAVVFREQLTLAVPAASVGLVLAGAATAGASGLAVRAFPRSHPVTGNAVGMGIGAALLLAASGLRGEAWTAPALLETRLAFAWLVGTTIVGFLIFVWMVRRWSATGASYATVLMPLVATAGGAALASEPVSVAFGFGAALVLAGVWVGAVRAPTASPAR